MNLSVSRALKRTGWVGRGPFLPIFLFPEICEREVEEGLEPEPKGFQ